MKEVKVFIDKTKEILDAAQPKKRTLRDQLANREKIISDITIQSNKISMAIEKLEVNFHRYLRIFRSLRNPALNGKFSSFFRFIFDRRK